jgi:hypothetical protein
MKRNEKSSALIFSSRKSLEKRHFLSGKTALPFEGTLRKEIIF